MCSGFIRAPVFPPSSHQLSPMLPQVTLENSVNMMRAIMNVFLSCCYSLLTIYNSKILQRQSLTVNIKSITKQSKSIRPKECIKTKLIKYYSIICGVILQAAKNIRKVNLPQSFKLCPLFPSANLPDLSRSLN